MQTRECLIEYWPGANKMGVILMALHEELHGDHEDDKKWKAESPLASESKLTKV